MNLTHDLLKGCWVLSGTEIEHLSAGEEEYEFGPDGIFGMTFKHSDGRSQTLKCRYALTEEGFVYGAKDDLIFEVTAWVEGEYLIFRPSHGMETWMVRKG